MSDINRLCFYATMDKFSSRSNANKWLENELKEEAKLLGIGFDLINLCVDELENIYNYNAPEELKKFYFVGSITLAKACHLLLGCYSLTMDGLSQEAGALFRPLLEVYELLIYFRDDPGRIQEALSGNLPKAGEIAKKISGKFKDLREYLNDHSSHFSYKVDSFSHLIDFTNAQINAYPTHSMSTFRSNLFTINIFQAILIGEVFHWLDFAQNENNKLLDLMESFIQSSKDIFKEET